MLNFLHNNATPSLGNLDRSQLTMVPEDLPSISFRHTFVLVGRATVYCEFVKMVCSSKAARFAMCQKSQYSIKANNPACGSSQSDVSQVSSSSSLNLVTRRSTAKRQTVKRPSDASFKCYCQIETANIHHSASRGVSQLSSIQHSASNLSPEARCTASNHSTPVCHSVSNSLSRQHLAGNVLISRVCFENVSYKYSSYIPRLSCSNAVLNTAFLFLLPLDPPSSKEAVTRSSCMSCFNMFAATDPSRQSRSDLLKEDISMLDLRLRQCQRMIQSWGKRYGEPLVTLVVLSDDYTGRKPSYGRQEARAAVEGLWKKWGPSGEGVLSDRFDYEWNGDRLHTLVTNLSEMLTQNWRTNSVKSH